jgi:hypothetical protein
VQQSSMHALEAQPCIRDPASAPQSVAGPSSLTVKLPALGQAPCHSVAAQLREGTTLETVACAWATCPSVSTSQHTCQQPQLWQPQSAAV